ncbi:component of cytosolic 80S ribosome and 40S small subunit [Volvox carteri f. nagariensis]|uniref:40S ribosomal protein S21 n=1 Tax=Volvox carteri f. nagariensis TaxID=3068 RepID=D8TV13_VOLCA|nr:component of cytosolic 80S ribosome and 40S small subunit [Volvox carteri f. nagariensis]EFJ48497.1 component of cytosolic 80S ribosome and 40S small subunit [Volvox carteri f. nagariensis]|eukprot:XP_002950296.1 component of cytosolic 80S ribosome and 40S small subunit [Volvox carteri f. nagariensis]
MINDEGQVVDLYIPRKCAWTNKLITAKDHASVQINIGHLDANGVYTNQFSTFAIAGNVRAMVRATLLWTSCGGRSRRSRFNKRDADSM